MWCELQWEEAFGGKSSLAIYGPAVVTVCFCIPLVLLVILYSIILIKLKQQAHPGEQSTNIEKQRTRRDKKVLKMAIAIVLVFFICFIPFVIGIAIYFYAPDFRSSCIFQVYYIVSLSKAIHSKKINGLEGCV